MSKSNLFSNVTDVLEDYLGPAGERFLRRQIKFHLKKKPEDITKADLIKLSEWIKVSLALLTEDKKIVDQCQSRLDKLAK